MSIYVIGATGRLGICIAEHFKNQKIIAINRNIYSDWLCSGSFRKIEAHFNDIQPDDKIFITAGILNPSHNPNELLQINYQLPRNLILALAERNPRIITFGTVMENIDNYQNSYILSKKKLSEFVSNQNLNNKNILHLQLHTLFGYGAPKEFMFLGQILNSLLQKTDFQMTSGNQLREYHHLKDEVKAIEIFSDSNLCGVEHLTHGEPIYLKDLAETIFSEMNSRHFLKIGYLSTPDYEMYSESYSELFKRSKILEKVEFRKTTPAILEYINNCLKFLI